MFKLEPEQRGVGLGLPVEDGDAVERRPLSGQPDDTAEDLADFLVGVGRAEQMIDGATRGRFGAVFHRRPGQECCGPPRPFVDPLLAGHAQHD